MSSKKEINISKRKTLTFKEIEEAYGVPAETVRKWTQRDLKLDGKPPLEAFKPGKEYLVEISTFERYMKMFPAA